MSGVQTHMALSPRYGLTVRARDCFNAIEHHMARHAAAPSYDDLAAALGLKSKSGVVRLIAELEERGWIRKLPMKPRSIEIVAHGEGSRPPAFAWVLPPIVEVALHAHCRRNGEQPADVVADAVTLFLDAAEADPA